MTASASTFYRDRHGRRVWVTADRVRVEDKTHTSNPHQPATKWFQMARPADTAAYAAKKVASGEWTAEENV